MTSHSHTSRPFSATASDRRADAKSRWSRIFRRAVHAAGEGGRDLVADAVGVCSNTVDLWGNAERGRKNGHLWLLDMLPRESVRVIAEEVARLAGCVLVDEVAPAEALDRKTAARELRRLKAEFDDVADLLLVCLDKGHMCAAEGADLKREGRELRAVVARVEAFGDLAERNRVIGLTPADAA